MHALRPALLLLASLTLAPFAPAQATPAACAAKAATLLDAMGHKDYAAASQLMGSQLQAPPQQKMLIGMWEALIRDNWGAYRSHGDASTLADDAGATTIRLPLQFEHGSTDATITCDAKQGGAVSELVLL